MSSVAQQIGEKATGETRNAAVSFDQLLDSGISVTGTPTVTSSSSGLSISSVAASTASLTINGRSVSAGRAVTFSVGDGTDGVDYLLTITAGTDSTPAETIIGYARLIVRDQA